MSKPTASRQMFSIDFTALSAHVDACLHELIGRGYAQRTIDRYRCALDHFSRWVNRASLDFRRRQPKLVQSSRRRTGPGKP